MSDCKTYWLHALTPLHVGVGTGSGFIDLPIMREKITNWPIIPGSAFKGVLADAFDTRCENESNEGQKDRLSSLRPLAFGQGGEDSANAGALVFTDARITCLAVRSYYGTFAYVTSPLVLSRIVQDTQTTSSVFKSLPVPLLNGEQSIVPDTLSAITVHGTGNVLQLCLGELNLLAQVSSEAKVWAETIAKTMFADPAWRDIFIKRFVIVPGDTFNFLCEVSCEVNARIKMERLRKIVQDGHFWYEESLPAESILSGLVWCDRLYGNRSTFTTADVMNEICGSAQVLQVGGKATVGKGRMHCQFENAHLEEGQHA